MFISAFSFQVQDTIPPVLPDTLTSSVSDTLLTPVLSDTLNTAIPDTMDNEPEEEPLIPIEFWNYSSPENFETAETDSTLRWINMVNLFNRFHSSRGTISYSMGTAGRLDAMDLHGYETRHLRLEMEGLRLNDPLTGNINWNRAPTQKIKRFSEDSHGATYRSEIRLKDYYLTQPRTYLNFDESKYNYRNLDFVFTQNIRQNTNIELSFWDRRDGGSYNRSSVEGRQAAVLAYHQLSDTWLVKGGYLNNAVERDESFGYVVSDPVFFTFNRFVETPNQNNASSNQASSDIFLQLHHRGSKFSDVSTELGLHYQTDKWSLTYPSDSLATSFNRAEVYAQHMIGKGPLSVTASARAFYLFETEKQNLSESSWAGARLDLDAGLDLSSRIRAYAYGSIEATDDSQISNELSGRLTIHPYSSGELSFFGGLLTQAPDIQSLYWESSVFTGDSDLLSEQTVTMGSLFKTGLGKWFSMGARADYRITENAVFVDTDNRFVNTDRYTQISGTGWFGLNSRLLEAELSATYKTYMSASQNQVNILLDTAGERTLLKGHLYWKNYIFDRAAFVTAGFSGIFSPNTFRTAEYLAPLNRWQHGTNSNRFQQGGGTFQFYNPSYYRVDLDVSARIRWFMLLLKWENLFDGMNQAGYFETTGYPMPERRFMLGLRILFTN